MGPPFPPKNDLKNTCIMEEAKKRDHRKLGKELDLFSIVDEAGPGLVIWHPKGAMLRYLIEEFERTEHLKRGYQMVVGPQILKRELWEKSGHFDNYRDNMYFTDCGRDRLRHQADELSCPHADLQVQDPIISRSSAEIFRAWNRPSARKERCASRSAQSQTVHSG